MNIPLKEFVVMRKCTLVLLAAVALMAPGAAVAQDKPVDVNFGGGFTFPVGDIADSFDTGWNGAVGVTFNVGPTIGIQAEYMYHRFGGPERSFPNLAPTPQNDGTVLIESNHQMHVGTFNLVLKGQGDAVGGYVLAGPGVYHRIIELTTPTVGIIEVCDPYWLICYPTAVETDAIIGDRSTTDFGFNVGGGITFGREAKFYVEARYHYVWGPTIENLPSGDSRSTNASYFPITFGFRF